MNHASRIANISFNCKGLFFEVSMIPFWTISNRIWVRIGEKVPRRSGWRMSLWTSLGHIYWNIIFFVRVCLNNFQWCAGPGGDRNILLFSGSACGWSRLGPRGGVPAKWMPWKATCSQRSTLMVRYHYCRVRSKTLETFCSWNTLNMMIITGRLTFWNVVWT